MIPLSTSRIYIFNVQNNNRDSDEWLSLFGAQLKRRFPELRFKSLELKQVKKSSDKNFKKEIHINHLFYLNRRTFDLDTSNLIRLKIIEVLNAVDFKFEQVHLINDGFDRNSSLGLSRRIL